jgi:hypothetical protein
VDELVGADVREMVTVTLHVPSAAAKGSGSVPFKGVTPASPPDGAVWVPYVLSVQLIPVAVQATWTLSATGVEAVSVTCTDSATGQMYVPVRLQVKPFVEFPAQGADKLAWASPMVAVTAPATSTPVAAA